jgi:hypothetical protein
MVVVLLCLLLTLPGCVRLSTVVAALEEREVESCVTIVGFVTPFVLTRIISATGGRTIEQCLGLPAFTLP